jgi:hypothetical protein
LLPKSTASKSSENKINTVSKVLIPGMSLALLSVILCRIRGNRSDDTPEDLGKPIPQNNLAEPPKKLAKKPIISAVKPVAASEPVPNLETFKKTKVLTQNCLENGKKITDPDTFKILSTYGRTGYRQINTILRKFKGKDLSKNFTCEVLTYEQLVSLLTTDEYFSRFKENCIVFRGIPFKDPDGGGMALWAKDNGIEISESMDIEEIRRKMIGQILDEWGFLSTTYTEDVTNGFSRFSNCKVKLKILAQKDMPCFDMNFQKAGVTRENEILFPPGTKLRVLDVEKNGNTFIVSAVMLLPNQS